MKPTEREENTSQTQSQMKIYALTPLSVLECVLLLEKEISTIILQRIFLTNRHECPKLHHHHRELLTRIERTRSLIILVRETYVVLRTTITSTCHYLSNEKKNSLI